MSDLIERLASMIEYAEFSLSPEMILCDRMDALRQMLRGELARQSEASAFSGRLSGKTYDQLCRTKLWCEANPGKKVALVSTKGRLEMTFVPDAPKPKDKPMPFPAEDQDYL